jgi:hypothetical protein
LLIYGGCDRLKIHRLGAASSSSRFSPYAFNNNVMPVIGWPLEIGFLFSRRKSVLAGSASWSKTDC